MQQSYVYEHYIFRTREFNISCQWERMYQNNIAGFICSILEDLELSLQNGTNNGFTINEVCIIIILFADDMVIIGNSIEDLQNSLNKLHSYCEKWGLEVNVLKTKIMVFKKWGQLRRNEVWYYMYNGQQVETVNNFNYLGIIFNYTGSFNLNNQYLIGKAMKASVVLQRNIYKYDVKPSIALQLFDAFVGPVLSYGCQIWGKSKSKDLERVQLKFCKSILGVKQSTSNMAVYGELGRFPLYIHRIMATIKYWLKLTQTDNLVLKTLYSSMIDDDNKG